MAKVQKLEHVGIVVNDLAAATAFFVDLGFAAQGEGEVSGEWVERVVGLDNLNVSYAFLSLPDGRGSIELIKFNSPAAEQGDSRAPANFTGLRHLALQVDDIEAAVLAAEKHGGRLVGEIQQYETLWKLCYLRGPEGIIIELAEQLG